MFVEADIKNHAQNTLETRGPYSLDFFFILVSLHRYSKG